MEACFDFSRALQVIRTGRKVSRDGWNGKGMFIFLVPGSVIRVDRMPFSSIYPIGTEVCSLAHIYLNTVDGSVVPWTASQSDLLAEDWRIV